MNCINGLQIGTVYTAVELVLAKFTGGTCIDASFNGLAGAGVYFDNAILF